MSILLGVLVGYAVALVRGEVVFDEVRAAAWVGLPHFTTPTFSVGKGAIVGAQPLETFVEAIESQLPAGAGE